MAYEQKDGDVIIFKNNKREKDTHPDYTGNALIDGKKMKVALWIKDGANGKFFAGSIKVDTYVAPEEKTETEYKTIDTDDLPF